MQEIIIIFNEHLKLHRWGKCFANKLHFCDETIIIFQIQLFNKIHLVCIALCKRFQMASDTEIWIICWMVALKCLYSTRFTNNVAEAKHIDKTTTIAESEENRRKMKKAIEQCNYYVVRFDYLCMVTSWFI